VVSTINGDANVPFYKELGTRKSRRKTSGRRLSVGERSSPALTPSRSSATWQLNYFESIHTPATAFINQWHAYIKNAKRTTNDPMEAHYIGFNLWVRPSKRRSPPTWRGARRAAGLESRTSPRRSPKVLPNHHITAGLSRRGCAADGQFERVGKAAARRRVMLVRFSCLAARISRQTG